MDEKESKTIFECPAAYSLVSKGDRDVEQKDALLQLEEESLVVLPSALGGGESILVPLRDILEATASDYRINILLNSNETLTLFQLGYRYEDFARVLFRLRNELIMKDMLMHESLRKSGAEADFVLSDEAGTRSPPKADKCEPRLYETGIVILPEKGEIIRIPYSDIAEIEEQDFALAITTEYGEKVVFSQMGRQFDPWKKALSECINELSIKVQTSLKDLLPTADPLSIRKAARYMKEGKAARRSDIESISPALWNELETKLELVGVKEEYDFLKALSQQQKICIGLKRGLLGDLTGEYIWFLIPIYSVRKGLSNGVYSTSPAEPGNAVAMEAASSEGVGKATYFFRLVSRDAYPKFKSIEDLHKEADEFIKRINRSMIAINFRREPIYLAEEKLSEPQYQKYKFAITRIPALRELRRLFIGRVIHRTEEQWKKDVKSLLKFNVVAGDNKTKWKRKESEQ